MPHIFRSLHYPSEAVGLLPATHVAFCESSKSREPTVFSLRRPFIWLNVGLLQMKYETVLPSSFIFLILVAKDHAYHPDFSYAYVWWTHCGESSHRPFIEIMHQWIGLQEHGDATLICSQVDLRLDLYVLFSDTCVSELTVSLCADKKADAVMGMHISYIRKCARMGMLVRRSGKWEWAPPANKNWLLEGYSENKPNLDSEKGSPL